MTALVTLNQARKRARQELWRRGRPSIYLLDEGQKLWIRDFWAGEGSAVWLVGRQRGKSFACIVGAAAEPALQNEGHIIRYCALTKDSAYGIVDPILKIILEDCPDSIRPRYVTTTEDSEGGVLQRKRLIFPSTGAELVIFGTDAQSFRKGRGPKTHVQLFDECGFYQDLVKVEEALRPAFQTTKGRALYLSTPPDSPGHPFVTRIRSASASGRLVQDTFWSNKRIDHEAVIREEASTRGQTRDEFIKSTYFKREFLAEVVVEETRAAIPSWTKDIAAECTKEWPRPEYYDGYTAHDWGGATGDPHAGLFGFYDYAAGKVVIEWESERRTGDTGELVAEWKAVELGSWGERRWEGTLLGAGEFDRAVKGLPEYLKRAISDKAQRQPFLRVCDNDEELQTEMLKHGYALLPTEKHDKHLAVDRVVVLVREKRLIVHPRCKRLLEQLDSTIWNEARTEWERTAKDHGDLVDCLVYLVRNIRWHRDPRPPARPSANTPGPLPSQQKSHPLAGLFKRKR